jgi:hypothetical protein
MQEGSDSIKYEKLLTKNHLLTKAFTISCISFFKKVYKNSLHIYERKTEKAEFRTHGDFA